MEYRYRESLRGDLALRFDPEVFKPSDRTDIEQEDIRVGGHFVISPKSRIVANMMSVDRDENTEINTISSASLIQSDYQKGYQAELQYLFQSQRYNAVMGVGHYDVDIQRRRAVVSCVPLPIPGFTCANNVDVTQKHDNAYSYISIMNPTRIIWTFGLSYDNYEIVDRDRRDRFNPKLGVQWQISDTVRLRAAVFKTVKRALAVNQTIEPTQVAGFNQFFDDNNATTATRYGLGLDFSLARSINAGLEYTRRSVEARMTNLLFDSFSDEQRDENFHRAYLYWTPTKNVAFSGEYQYEKFDRNEQILRQSKTHILPLSLRYFSTQGVFSELGASYVRQDVYREGQLGSTIIRDSDTFLLIDGTFGYRLPKRRGSVSFVVRNLFDKNFNYYDINPWVTEFVQPRFIPDRTFFAQLTLHL